MAKTDYKTIDEYHQAFPREIQDRMQTIREIVRNIAPKAEELISYQIPAFKIGKSFLIYYSAYAKHISLATPWSAVFLKEFDKELKGKKVTKSAIQFPHDEPLPADLLKRMVKFRKGEVEGKA